MEGAIGERLGAGKEAEVFAFGSGVVKLYPAERGKAAAFREAATLVIVEGLGLPAPRVEAVGLLDGRWGVAMTRAPGRTFAEQFGDDGAGIARAVEAAVRLQIRVHDCPGDGLPDQKARLAADIDAAPRLGTTLRHDLLARLSALPAGDRLCHGDFHFSNLLGSFAEGVIVDWLDAARGAPAADACRTYLLLMRRHQSLATAYLEAYGRIAGVPETAILDWLPVCAAARLAEGAEGEDDFLMELASSQGPRG